MAKFTYRTPGAEVVSDGREPGSESTREVVKDYTPHPDMPGCVVIPSRDVGYGNAEDTSGLQINRFNPHIPGPQLIDPHLDGDKAVLWDPLKDKYPYAPAKSKSASTGQPKMSKEAELEMRLGSSTRDVIDATPTTMPAIVNTRVPLPNSPKKVIPGRVLPDPARMDKNAVTVINKNVAAPDCKVYIHVPGMKMPYLFHEVQLIADQKCPLVVLVFDTSYQSPELNDRPEFQDTAEGEYIVLSTDDYPNILFCEFLGQRFKISDTIEVTVLLLAHEQAKES